MIGAEQPEEGTAQHLVGVPAEQGGGGRVPACDDEIGIELEEGIAGVLQHVLQAALLLPQLLLHGAALAHLLMQLFHRAGELPGP